MLMLLMVFWLSVGAGVGRASFELSFLVCRLYLDVFLVAIAFLVALLFS